MAALEYTDAEKHVMQLMAHGHTREAIAEKLRFSTSSVARIARDATDKAVAVGAPIIQGIATMVAEGSISVPFKGQKQTARETALFWLHTQMMSSLDADDLVQLRDTYQKMLSDGVKA